MEDEERTKINEEKLKKHPREATNFLSHLFFCWQIPVILKGWRKELTEEDLYRPLEDYKSRRLGDQLEQLWQNEEHFQKNPSLLRVLVKLYGPRVLFYGVLYCPFHFANFLLQPLYLQKLLNYYTPNQTEVTSQQAHFYASMIVIVNILNVLTVHFTSLHLDILGMKIRIACSSLIYRKALKLKRSDLEKVTIGKMVNLLSNDVNRFDYSLTFINYLWMAPINFVLGIWYINQALGPSAITGFVIIFSFIAVQVLVAKKLAQSRKNVAVRTDYRVRLMNDIICGINAIKLYTWERPFAKLVETIRKPELYNVKSTNNLRLINATIRIYSSNLCLLLPLVVAVVTGSPITSQYVFILSSIYNMFRITLATLFQVMANVIAETKISIQRIQDYLLYGNQKTTLVNNQKLVFDLCLLKSKLNYNTSSVGVQLKNVSVKWDESSGLVLDKVDFEARPGDLVGVVGAAGSGKSTLLHAILKEVHVVKGTVDVEGTVSYAGQEAWIFGASVKQNILFGQVFDLTKYLKVIRVCGLEHDLLLFPHGDQTIVGERGVMLSGGQKARINLARAVYRDADVYLLDDPLSAVDSHVAQQIFNECVSDYLKTKCVVLVTHQVQYLRNVSKVYCLDKGKIVDDKDAIATLEKYALSSGDRFDEEQTETTAMYKNNKIQCEIKEHRSSGSNDLKVYRSYAKAAGHFSFLCFVLFQLLIVQICSNCLDNFITFWVNLEQNAIALEDTFSTFFSTYNCLYIYISLTILLILLAHFTTFCFVMFCQRASKNLHNNMLQKIIHGTMTFFNHQSSGRILNRFTKDIGCIDEQLPFSMMIVLNSFITAAGSICNISISNYWLVPAVVLLLAIAGCYSYMFQNTSTNLKRTEGTSRFLSLLLPITVFILARSNVFTHLSASVQGLTTIRSFGLQEKIVGEFDRHQDLHSSAAYLFKATYYAFGFWIDLTCIIFTTFVIFSFFLVKGESIGYVGLAITQSVSLTLLLQFGLKHWSELSSQMVSVERVVEYAELDPEPDDGKTTPPEEWPMAGNVSFSSVSLRYDANSLVLNKISFDVKSGEKVGIVGRTGAGKTSLISVLFRLYQFDGLVHIDGVDTKSLPLNTLRSKISIIPQDPVLFLGTLRKNIDPFDEYSDDQIWTCLEEIELKEMVSKLPAGLESVVSEKGTNFSVGQKQLLCLVRAMLRNNKIIALDEATANVDLRTDELIQSTIRNKFKDCTVLTIAHRLNTVIDCDRILVMDDGEVVEFGHPLELLQNTKGFFYQYVKNNGMMTQFTEKLKKQVIKI